MLIRNNKLEIKLNYPIHKPYKKEDIIFFDIETTGFLPSASYLYLIGAMYYKEDAWQLTQWFADDMQSELEILEAFLTFLGDFKRIIHYNGLGFDLPYLEKKCKQYKIYNPLTTIESFDLYKKFNTCKKLLPLTNLKLKTIETFAGVHREDKLSGEELIQIYANFLGKYQFEKLQLAGDKLPAAIPRYEKDIKTFEENMKSGSSSQLLSLLLLHNTEDVMGLIKISNILYYTDIFDHMPAENSVALKIQFAEDNQVSCLIFKQELPYSFDKPVHIKAELMQEIPSAAVLLRLYNKELTIQIPIYYGTLKYFPDNYKDYFYLPKEDMVVHKSVAQFVDKEFREKVKAKDCYIKKDAAFLPMPAPIILPTYQVEYKDKISFAEFKQSDFMNSQILIQYFHSLLEFIKSNGTVQ